MFADNFRPPGSRPEDLWDAWAFAAMEAELALDAWRRAARELKASAFAAYRAALDREEQAAARLAERVRPKMPLMARAAESSA
jgi:hypothetical protein